MPPTNTRIAITEQSRMFSIVYRAGPNNAPQYQGFWKAEAVSWRQGDIRTIRYPSDRQIGQFINAGKIRGEPGYPELRVMAKYTLDASDMLKLVRRGCDLDLQVHLGQCKSPNDFNGGWTDGKVLILENASITDYGTGNLGALEPADRAQVEETIPFTGQDYYEVLPMVYSRQASTLTLQEVVSITVCDSVQCGLCGVESDGCQVAFAVEKAHGGSPGLPARVFYTQNGGATWNFMIITAAALAANQDPVAMACIGVNLVITSTEGGGLVYAPIADVLNGNATWTKVTTGVVGGSEPRAIFSLGPTYNWFVGLGGYIYFTSDPTSGLTVQDAGVATTSQLNAVHGIDANHLVAVGASNAVVFTNNGGQTWVSVTGPNVGQALNTVWMQTQYTWWVGDAAGKLWYTINAGQTWVQKSFPKQALGQVRDIKFTTPSVGWMTCDDGTKAYILRTLDGGYDWFIVPDNSSVAMPVNKQINQLATCADPNILFAGGINATTVGTLIKGA